MNKYCETRCLWNYPRHNPNNNWKEMCTSYGRKATTHQKRNKQYHW